MAEAPDASVEPAPVKPDGIECPECSAAAGSPVYIPPRGRMNLPASLGFHRRTEHGVEGARQRGRDDGPAKRSKRSSGPSRTKATPLTLVTDTVRDEVTGKRAPTVDQLTNTFGKLYGYASYGVAAILVDGDPNVTTEDQADAIVEQLCPSDADARAIVRPLARLAGKSKLNSRYGRTVVDNSDVLDAIVAIVEQSRAFRSYLRARAAGQAPAIGSGGAGVGPPVSSAPPGPTQGILATPAWAARPGAVSEDQTS